MITRKCKKCGKTFTISDSEENFFIKKNLELPKKCKKCRDEAKHEKNRSNSQTIINSHYQRSEKSVSPILVIVLILILLFAVFFGVKRFTDYLINDSGNSHHSEASQLVTEAESVTETYHTTENTTEHHSEASQLVTEAESVTETYHTTENTTEHHSEALPIVTEAESVVTAATQIATQTTIQATEASVQSTAAPIISYTFRNQDRLDEHYQKHGIEMGFASASEYQQAAAKVVTSSKAQHKLEKEDGDDVYFIADTGEFVIVSTDGYIRTYYYTDQDYFDRQ